MATRIAIKDICKIYDGPHATPQKTETGPVYLGIDAITDDGKIDPNQYSHLSEKDYVKWTKRITPQYGDIVFSYEATLGRYALIPKDFYGCLGRRLAVIRNISPDVDTTWLYYYFRSAEWTNFIQSKIVKGSTVNRISIEDFPHYTIPCVSIGTQKKIVDVLLRIDRKIQINDALEQISVESKRWKENAIQDSFGQAKNIYTYLLIIPANEKGALERVIIDVLNDIPEETALMGEVEQFIDALKAGLVPDLNQINNANKATVGTFFSVRYPKKAMRSFGVFISKIDWSKSASLNQMFLPFQCLGEDKPL